MSTFWFRWPMWKQSETSWLRQTTSGWCVSITPSRIVTASILSWTTSLEETWWACSSEWASSPNHWHASTWRSWHWPSRASTRWASSTATSSPTTFLSTWMDTSSWRTLVCARASAGHTTPSITRKVNAVLVMILWGCNGFCKMQLCNM